MESSPSIWQRLASFWLVANLFISSVLAQSQPNILIILSDDQDGHMQSSENMPSLQSAIVSQGATHTNHFCSIALCCPSRANLWSGRYSHNTNVTDVSLPYGGYPKVVSEGINDSYLPIWMQAAGYATYYIGKLWNGHSVKNYNKPFAKGFDGSNFILAPNQYLYFNSSFCRNGETPYYAQNQYAPDVVAAESYNFLKEALAQDKPWFMVSAPVAPHVQVEVMGEGEGRGEPPPSAPRHANAFPDYIIPRTPDFNPDTPGGAAYYKNLPQLNQTVIDYNDEWQRKRMRALLSVDDMIKNLTDTLDAAGQLNNTYIIYTTDNGYHLSQHRLFGGKRCGLDTDIKIPFFVRGPGIGAGSTVDDISSHVDMSPTILALAGAAQRDEFDGAAMQFSTPGSYPTQRAEHVEVEHWGMGLYEGIYGQYGDAGTDGRSYPNNTYKSVRVVGDGYSLYYSAWCDGEHEYYDMIDDPYQLDNLFNDANGASNYTFDGRPFKQVTPRLDTLLLVLKSCKADTCRNPWGEVFPEGGVSNLRDALDSKYDDFFSNQPQVSWTTCDLGYIVEVEGPQDPNIYGNQTKQLRQRGAYQGEIIWNGMD